MRSLRLLSLGLALALPVLAASPGKPSPHADKANKAFAAAMVKADAAAVSNLYTKDAQLLFMDGKTYKGRMEIQGLMAGYFKESKIKAMTITSEESHMLGDALLDTGHYETAEVSNKDGKETTSKGRYLQILKKGKDGQWRLFRDCPLAN